MWVSYCCSATAKLSESASSSTGSMHDLQSNLAMSEIQRVTQIISWKSESESESEKIELRWTWVTVQYFKIVDRCMCFKYCKAPKQQCLYGPSSLIPRVLPHCVAVDVMQQLWVREVDSTVICFCCGSDIRADGSDVNVWRLNLMEQAVLWSHVRLTHMKGFAPTYDICHLNSKWL